jgi:hypothetical protein
VRQGTAVRAGVFHGGCLFSVEERVAWRVWECVGDVVVCIGDVLGLFTCRWRWRWWTSLGQSRRRWGGVDVHIFESGSRDPVIALRI